MKPERFLVMADPHGDRHDPETIRAILAFKKEFCPTLLVHLGDNWDFRNLRKGASDDEKAESLEDDWEQGREILREFFNGGKKNVFLRGNHDERLWDFCRSATGLLRDYAHDGTRRIEQIVRQAKAVMLPYDSALGIYQIGRLAALHGFHTGKNACREHAACYRNCIFGHVHTIESSPVAALEPAEARSIGCACIRDMDYANKRTGKLRWGQGFAYGHVWPDGSYQLFQARKINGSFHVATDLKEL